MRTASVRRGDIVYVDKGGRRFLALVMRVKAPDLDIEPLTRGISYKRATSREVVGHFRRATGTPDLCGSHLTSHLQVVAADG